jgi:hypothetical protein
MRQIIIEKKREKDTNASLTTKHGGNILILGVSIYHWQKEGNISLTTAKQNKTNVLDSMNNRSITEGITS